MQKKKFDFLKILIGFPPLSFFVCHGLDCSCNSAERRRHTEIQLITLWVNLYFN